MNGGLYMIPLINKQILPSEKSSHYLLIDPRKKIWPPHHPCEIQSSKNLLLTFPLFENPN